MKKISRYVALAFAGLLMASCSDDFTDWAQPTTPDEEDAITVSGLTAYEAPAIDFATLAEDQDSVRTFALSQGTLPQGFTWSNTRVELTPQGVDSPTTTTLSASLNGNTLASALEELVESTFGRRPTARVFTAHVYLDAVRNGEAVLIDAGTVNVTMTPEAPQISDHYYLIGAPSEWSPTCTTLPFTHSGKDVYDDPEFTVMFPVGDGDTWFAISDDVAVASGAWSDVFGCKEGNGNNGMEGSLDRRANLSDEGSWKISVAGDAKFVKMTINMMDYTYTLEKVNFAEYFYEIGNESGWATSHALRSPSFDGKYQGYYYLDGEFKFKPNADNWDGDYEYAGEGKLTQTGSDNCPAPDPSGFYQIDVDLTQNTYKLTQVTSISATGDFNSWGGDVDLAYNKSTGAWEASGVEFATTGGVKFRMNHDWSVSWGGNGSGTAFGDLTQNNGANLTVEAGTYDIQLFISHEGANKVVLTRK